MMLSTKLVLFLCFVGSVLAQFESICNYDCVATDVYGPYCGGAVCVYGETDPAQHEQLCSQECADAILGKPMRDCVLSENPNPRNLAAETRNMVLFIRVFCDNFGVETPPLPPLPAPLSEPLAPPSEDPGVSGPIDPPEVAMLTVEDIYSEPVEPPKAMDTTTDVETVVGTDVEMDSPTAPMSGASPEKDLDEDNDGDAVDDLNEI